MRRAIGLRLADIAQHFLRGRVAIAGRQLRLGGEQVAADVVDAVDFEVALTTVVNDSADAAINCAIGFLINNFILIF